MGLERFKKPTYNELKNAINQKDYKDVLYSLYSRFGFECLDVLKNVKANWSLIIKNDDLREFCIPNSFKDGILYVKINQSVAKMEFMNNLNDIKLNLKIIFHDLTFNDVMVLKER